MKKFLPSLFVLFCFLISIVSCTPKKWLYEGVDGTMKNEILGVFTQQQIDSLCIADTLPINLGEWIPLLTRDYESGEKMQQYLFIKKHSSDETIYVITRYSDNENYRIQKRSVK